MKARLYERYVKEVVPLLKEKHKYSNVHEIPRMEKIVVNMGVSASLEKSAVDDAAKDLALITGRKPTTSKSRHNIAKIAAEQMLDILEGKRPPRLLNPEVWPAYQDRFQRILGFRPEN